MTQLDLFDIGEPLPAFQTMPQERRCIPGVSGRGPAGETCRTCKHKTYNEMGRKYLKCDLTRGHWTRGPGTDIKAGWPACEKWEPRRPLNLLADGVGHADDCKLRIALACATPIECEHGWDVCPICDPCTCHLYSMLADYWEERGETTKAWLCRHANSTCCENGLPVPDAGSQEGGAKPANTQEGPV